MCQNIKIQKHTIGYTQNRSEEVFIISKIKNTVRSTYVINGEPIDGTFYEKELQKINCTLNGKDTIIRLMVGLMKKTLYKNESILS